MSFFFFQAEDGIRDYKVTGVQTCALPIWEIGTLAHAASLRRHPLSLRNVHRISHMKGYRPMNYLTKSDTRLHGQDRQEKTTSRKSNLKAANPRGRKTSQRNWWMRVSGIFLLWATTAIASHAQTFNTVVTFDGSNGYDPVTIVQGEDGNLWGATDNGGSSCGTVFNT